MPIILWPRQRLRQQHGAFDAVRLGDYVSYGVQPLHESVNGDGDAASFRRLPISRSIHSRFKSVFLNALSPTTAEITPPVGAPAIAKVTSLNGSSRFSTTPADKMQHVHILEKQDGFGCFVGNDVRALIYIPRPLV